MDRCVPAATIHVGFPFGSCPPGRLELLPRGLKGHRRRRAGTDCIPRTDEYVVGGVGLQRTDVELITGGEVGQ